MTRQLVDVLYDTCGVHRQRSVERLVASLLTDGPAEHTCPTCEGTSRVPHPVVMGGAWDTCPDCRGECVVLIGVIR